MAPLTVLSDGDVNQILHSLRKEDILELQQTLADALHWYSTSTDANDFGSDYQPERTALRRKDGATTLFMPASGLDGQGVKIINIVPDHADGLPMLAEDLSISSDGDGSLGSTSSASSTSRNGSLLTADTARSSNSTLVTSSTASVDDVGRRISTSSAEPAPPTVRSSLTLLDSQGNTTGIINTNEVTAFRTALASSILFKRRHSVRDVTVFGAGKQAYWHIRLALLLRGDEIHHLNIVSRSFESARSCIKRLYNPQPHDPEYVNMIGAKYNSKTKKNILTPDYVEYERLLKEYVRASTAIFCCTPSTTPLFPATFLTNPEGRKKGRYIACIGSLKPHMVELHPEIVRSAVSPHHQHHHEHKHLHLPHLHQRHQRDAGAILVDSLSGCLREAGELVQARVTADQVVELGELVMLKRDAERERARTHDSGCQFKDTKSGADPQHISGLEEWLTKGNVVYKSVGLGLVDVVVGDALLRIARDRGIGTVVQDF